VADAKGVPELTRARAASQLLADSKLRSPADVVRHLLAVQAQDFPSFPLALRARAKGLTLADVHGALDSGELVVSWLNRGTLHLVCREDYWWLHALTAPTTHAANARRLIEEGVTNAPKHVRAIKKALADGPLLRKTLGERIGLKAGALTHVLLAASLEGLIVRGPVHGRQQTFVLAADHIGEPGKIDRDQALDELGRRYAAGHAPSTDGDLAYWARLPLRDVRGRMPQTRVRAARKLPAKLLPAFDPYIMGYKERSFAIPSSLNKRVIPGGGMFRAVVLIDGQVAGTWSRAGGRVAVDDSDAGLDREIADVERFLG
jgi:hypothetical protein